MERDKTGKLRAEPTNQYRDNIDPNTGKKCGQSQMYILYADDGTKVQAYKNLSKDKRFDTDCHGFTLTDGEYWIDNSEAEKAFKGDNYQKVPDEKANKGDVEIWKTDGKIKHSARVSGVIKLADETIISTYGLGGTEIYPDYKRSTDSSLSDFGEPGTYRKIDGDTK